VLSGEQLGVLRVMVGGGWLRVHDVLGFLTPYGSGGVVSYDALRKRLHRLAGLGLVSCSPVGKPPGVGELRFRLSVRGRRVLDGL
jgi:hypothetical protein